jgi:cell division septal protein FtsQ
MSDDKFLDYIRKYATEGKGAEKTRVRNSMRTLMLAFWVAGLAGCVLAPSLLLLWIPYTIFLVFYSGREYML